VPPFILRPFLMKFLTTALAPSTTLFEAGAVLVNRRGERFCEETKQPAYALPDQPGKEGWIILDGALARQFSQWPNFISTAPGVAYAYVPDYKRNRKDIYTECDSIESLAAALDMEAAALRKSLTARSGAANMTPPYIALGPVHSVFVHSEGGLRVDTQHRVLDRDGQPLPGLYAAGSTGQGGLLLKGHGHHLAWAFVSGRRAGRFAARTDPAL
jgi:fumarate reductase flavoprotein subunit